MVICENVFKVETIIYGAWMISRHIFNLQTGQNGFSKTPIAQSF